MKNMAGSLTALGLATAIVIGQGDRLLHAQNATDPNAAPNPYRMEEFAFNCPTGVNSELQSEWKSITATERHSGFSSVAVATHASARPSIQ